MKSLARAYGCLGVTLLLAGLPGCGCRNEPPRGGLPTVQSPTSPVVRAQTPTTPLPQTPTTPRAQTPTTPRVAQSPTAPPPAIKPAPVLGLDAMRLVKEGMSNQEVAELLGRPGFVMSQTGEETIVYRWVDPESATLLARFENGKLTRKNVIAADGVELTEQKSLSEDDYNAIAPGMSLDEALVLIGVEPKSQNMGRDGASIVRWADKNGSSFTALFQDGKLVRKTGFHVSRKPGVTPAEGNDVAATESVPVVAEDSAEAPATTAEEVPAIAQEAPGPEIAEAPTPPEKRPRVRSTRTTRPDDEKARSYNPKAKLPEFSHGLREGAFEVRISNPTDSKVKAGLRLGNRGADVTVPPRGSRSVKVDRGTYRFYFVSEADPYSLNGGGSVDLTSMFATDLEISVFDEDYEVRLLDATP